MNKLMNINERTHCLCPNIFFKQRERKSDSFDINFTEEDLFLKYNLIEAKQSFKCKQ